MALLLYSFGSEVPQLAFQRVPLLQPRVLYTHGCPSFLSCFIIQRRRLLHASNQTPNHPSNFSTIVKKDFHHECFLVLSSLLNALSRLVLFFCGNVEVFLSVYLALFGSWLASQGWVWGEMKPGMGGLCEDGNGMIVMWKMWGYWWIGKREERMGVGRAWKGHGKGMGAVCMVTDWIQHASVTLNSLLVMSS